MTDQLPAPANPAGRLLTADQFQHLADVPPEIEWFANPGNKATRRACENALRDFMQFTGIVRSDEFRSVARAHIIPWRDALAKREPALSSQTLRHRLAALSSLLEYLYERNAVTHNQVKGVKRPPVESYEGKTPALGDHQARKLNAPLIQLLPPRPHRRVLRIFSNASPRSDGVCEVARSQRDQEFFLLCVNSVNSVPLR